MSNVAAKKNKSTKIESCVLTTTSSSPNTITIDKTEYNKLESEVKRLKFENLVLQEKVDLLTYKRFVHSSEKLNDNQKLLFDESEIETIESPESDTDNDKTKVKEHERKKAGRKPIPENLPRKKILNDLNESEKHCSCGCELIKIGEDTNEKLVIEKPRIYVEQTVTPKYVCPCCSKAKGDDDAPSIRVAPTLPAILPGSIASAKLLSHIFVSKFCDGLPYYRIEKQFERIGVSISRQDMSNWQVAVYSKLYMLCQLLKEHIKTGNVLRMDETTVQVMGEENRADTKKSYIWLARGGPPDKIAVIFKYKDSRASENIGEFIAGYSGFLQTDGYAGYDSALSNRDDIIHVGCFAHARRKFFEAQKVSSQSKSAAIGLKYIRKLYSVETELRDKKLSDAVFVEQRKAQTKSTLDNFKKWLDKLVTNTKAETLLQKAVNYAHNQWDKLIAYLGDAELTPDNNLSENAIRPFVIGRKNWLFYKSTSGAESACSLYSLIETAKINNIDPSEYLTYLFERAPYAVSTADWIALLPWNVNFSTGKN
jgi:transposase